MNEYEFDHAIEALARRAAKVIFLRMVFTFQLRAYYEKEKILDISPADMDALQSEADAAGKVEDGTRSV